MCGLDHSDLGLCGLGHGGVTLDCLGHDVFVHAGVWDAALISISKWCPDHVTYVLSGRGVTTDVHVLKFSTTIWCANSKSFISCPAHKV